MKIFYQKIYFQIICLILIGFLIGCAPQAKLLVLKPAEIDTANIKKVAVGVFEVGYITQQNSNENQGIWNIETLPLTNDQKKSIARQIRAQVVNSLGANPYFELLYTDEFAKLENDAAMLNLIRAAGYKSKDVDAVISGKVWVELEKTRGADLSKSEMRFVSGGRNSIDVSVEKMLWWPFHSMRGTVVLEIKMTRLKPTEIMASTINSRSFSAKKGGEPADFFTKMKGTVSTVASLMSKKEQAEKKMLESSDQVLPSFTQSIAMLSSSIATDFIRRVAVTEKQVAYDVATGGDKQGKFLVEAGAYEMAIERLQKVSSKEKKGDDLYNLALAFEAIGEYGLAQELYKEAFSLESDKLLFAQGLGRIERIMRENPKLKSQLRSKR